MKCFYHLKALGPFHICLVQCFQSGRPQSVFSLKAPQSKAWLTLLHVGERTQNRVNSQHADKCASLLQMCSGVIVNGTLTHWQTQCVFTVAQLEKKGLGTSVGRGKLIEMYGLPYIQDTAVQM